MKDTLYLPSPAEKRLLRPPRPVRSRTPSDTAEENRGAFTAYEALSLALDLAEKLQQECSLFDDDEEHSVSRQQVEKPESEFFKKNERK